MGGLTSRGVYSSYMCCKLCLNLQKTIYGRVATDNTDINLHVHDS